MINLDTYLSDYNDEKIKKWLVEIDYYELCKVWFLNTETTRNKILNNVSERLKDRIIELAETYKNEELSEEDILNAYKNLLKY